MKTTKQCPYIACRVDMETHKLIKVEIANTLKKLDLSMNICVIGKGKYKAFTVLPKDIPKNYLKVLEYLKKDTDKHIEKLKLQQNKIINKIVELKQTHE